MNTNSEGRRFLALGDSYTIGESVTARDRWPAQLATLLAAEGIEMRAPQIIARTGWTTADLAGGIRRDAPAGPYDLVSLLIGVNNQYRGLSSEQYREEFHGLIEQAIGFAGGNASRVIVLSIPDWGATPFAEGRDRALIGREIDAFNAINRDEADRAGARYVDISADSRQAAANPALTAPDGLHPSGELYARWAARVLPEARAAFGS
ncbi:MAG: SGNH/GDSL hydrolase family protein [Anaerolineaceae bacterium]